MVQRVFESYHDHIRKFLALLDSEGSEQSKLTLERLVVAAERELGTFAEVIAMLKAWETADGMEAIQLAVTLELVTAVDKLNRRVVERAKVLAHTAEDAPAPSEINVGEQLQTLTDLLPGREALFTEHILHLNQLLEQRKPVLSEMDLDVMAWQMEDGRGMLTGNIERIRRWAKNNADREVEALAAIQGCEALFGYSAEVVRMIAMLRGHTVDGLLLAKPGAAKPPVN